MHFIVLLISGFVLATCHHAENTDDLDWIASILSALDDIYYQLPTLLAQQSLTPKLIGDYGFTINLNRLAVFNPLPVIIVLFFRRAAHVMVADSCGARKSVFFYCVTRTTMRKEIGWAKTVSQGWNMLVDRSFEKALITVNYSRYGETVSAPYEVERVCESIISAKLENSFV